MHTEKESGGVGIGTDKRERGTERERTHTEKESGE